MSASTASLARGIEFTMREPHSVAAVRRRRSIVLAALLAIVLGGLPALATPALADPGGGNSPISIDQCANGKASTSRTDCSWVNGNLNPASNSQYREGNSVAFRAVIPDLESGDAYRLTIAWDTIRGDDVAYDYLTSWNCTESGDPRGDASAPDDTFPIPVDARITAATGNGSQVGNCTGGTGADNVFSIWGGDITAVSDYRYADGSTGAYPSGTMETQVDITFTASGDPLTIAWGGHVSIRDEWDTHLTAVEANQNQSPYHMRLKDTLVNLDTDDGEDTSVTTGNQDRSMKARAGIGQLGVAKTASDSTVGPGDTFSYTITASSIGTGSAPAYTVKDTSLAFPVVSVDPAANCAFDDTNDANAADDVSCTFPAGLSVGDSQAIVITVKVPAVPTCATFVNTAVLSYDGSDDQTDTASVTVAGCTADPTIAKSPDEQDVSLGGTATWTLVVTNATTASAPWSGTVTDTVVDVFENVTAKIGGDATPCAATSGNVVSCEITNLAPEGKVTIDVTATALNGADARKAATAAESDDICGTYQNVASLSFEGRSSNTVDVTLTDCFPDLDLDKVLLSAEPIAPGGTADFKITVDNTKGTAKGSATVQEIVPAGWTLTTLTTTDGTCDPTGPSCDVTVAAGGTAVIEVSMTAPTGDDACGQYDNEAAIQQLEQSASASVTVNDGNDCEPGSPPPPPPPPPPAPDSPAIDLVKTGSTTTATIGDIVEYEYVITNTGDVPLVDVTLTDLVEAGGDTATLSLLEVADGITLAVGESTTVTSTWTVTEDDLPGPLDNTATATGVGAGQTVSDVDDWSVDLTSSPAIAVVKTPDVANVVFSPDDPAPTITYTYEVTNTGDVTLTDVTLDDDVLGAVTLATTTLAPGESTTGTAVHGVTLEDAILGSITNVATATGTPPVGDDVQAQDTAVVEVAQVLGEIIEREPEPDVEPVEQERLPATGTDAPLALLVAIVLTATGWTLVTERGIGRRRRRRLMV